ncbi:Molybdopterin synthase sulfur carrier subunit [hydrothermal vent metagenome]|uniref:Molybdopterin synthase sulfur carrier subunit n=1 Tax=hydrothermal vent metagenome TaxID=652676 RepID=A0A3B0YN89_9ZZZZ
MRVEVRFFASLRERIGRAGQALSLPESATVADVWLQAVGEKSIPSNVLAAINGEYVVSSSSVSDGDEVAFFPPVTGG